MKSGLLLAGIPIVLMLLGGQQGNPPRSANAPAPSSIPIPNIARYQSWPCANETPHFVFPAVAMDCRMLSPEEYQGRVRAERKSYPHANYHIRVYVSPGGSEEFLGKKVPELPVGTVIVKEKLPDKTAKTPEVLTVMVKRKKGFDTNNGDWEYFALSGDARRLLPGKTTHCQTCHQKVKDAAYLFRHYLPEAVLKSLK